jgi:hypothetical protein
MRPELEDILQRLLARSEKVISLDVVGEAIGAAQVAQSEIEDIFLHLERAGIEIAAPTAELRQNLGPVLLQARRLKHEQATTPSPSAIAAATGLTVAEVRAALLYASVLGR